MSKIRRPTDAVCKEIAMGLLDYEETKTRLLEEAAARRASEARRRVEERCGTVCRGLPAEWMASLPVWQWAAPAAPPQMLN
jgi:hypothetical protein